MIPLEEIYPDMLRTMREFPEPGCLAPRRVLLYAFNAMPPLVPYFALYGNILAHRGCTVDLVWRPYLEAHQYLTREELDAHNARAERILATIGHPRLRAVNLAETPLARLSPETLLDIDRQAAMDVSHYRRSLETDIEGADREIFRRYQRLHQDCLAALSTLMRENRYDSALMPTGDGVQFGAAYRFFRARNLPVCTVEAFRCGLDRAALVSWGLPAVSFNRDFIDGPWAAFDADLDDETLDRLLDRLKRRFQNQGSGASIQIASGGQGETLRELLALDPRLPTLLITPSHNYEKHFRLRHEVFANGLRWFEETLTHLAGRDDCQVIVRLPPLPGSDGESDPHELGVSRDSGIKTLARLFPEVPPHFRLFGPFDKVNTYDLMEFADCCLTYNSTTGLEMALLGKAGMAPSSIHYAGKGFTIDPDTKEEYFRQLDRLIRDPLARKLSAQQVRLAKRYTAFLYFHFPRRLPWSLRHHRFLYDLWPARRLLSLEGVLSPFMASIDYLADERADHDAQAKFDEVSLMLEAIRTADDDGDADRVRLLTGELWNVDLVRLRREHPRVLELLLARWTGLVSLVISRDPWRARDFLRRLEDLERDGESGPKTSRLREFLREAATAFEAGGPTDGGPRLFERDCLGLMDIFAYRGRYFGMRKNLDPAAPDAYDSAAINELEKQALCFTGQSPDAVREKALAAFQDLPVLIREGHRGYNIVLCRRMLYAFAQELGPLDPLKLLRNPQPLVNAGLLLFGRAMEELLQNVDDALARRTARLRRLSGEDA